MGELSPVADVGTTAGPWWSSVDCDAVERHVVAHGWRRCPAWSDIAKSPVFAPRSGPVRTGDDLPSGMWTGRRDAWPPPWAVLARGRVA